eukprot:4574539-Prorocentrum_lima.AAC.1
MTSKVCRRVLDQPDRVLAYPQLPVSLFAYGVNHDAMPLTLVLEVKLDPVPEGPIRIHSYHT